MRPTVTVSVLTYNSSKYVIETLESIKAQTYPHLILHVCDDCSTDNTIEICREWVEINKERFVSTDIIIPDHNTGISANSNRAWDACTTEYQKEIAGDDILLPNCIEDNMQYVKEHPEAVIVFSRMKSFGVSEERCRYSDEHIYIYDFFNWDTQKQYDFLYNERNCIPAPTSFVNIQKIRKLGLRHDERIPLQEDVAKWQNALKMDVQFFFFDKTTVMYRIHEASLSTATLPSPKSRESCALYWFYYHFEEEYKRNPDLAIKDAVKQEINYYKMYYNEVKSIRNSKRFRIVNILLFIPLDFFKRYFNIIKRFIVR